MKKDQAIMNALEPNLANRDDGDFIMESTPNGRRGFFFDYWNETMKKLKQLYGLTSEKQLLAKLWKDLNASSKIDWYPLMWDYTEGIRYKVVSEKYLEIQKQNPKIDFDQEYCCSFTSSYTQAIPTEALYFKDENASDYKESIDLLGPRGINRKYGDFDY